MNLNYFEGLCFFWAAIGFGSRILMGILGNRWNEWELSRAYAKQRPPWIYGVAILGFLLVALTWLQVIRSPIPFDWIIAALVTLTLVKLSALLFAYDQFRTFVTTVLSNPGRFRQLNIAVIAFSLLTLAMGIWLY